MFVPLALTRAPNPWCLHPGERDQQKPLGEAAAPASPYGSTERMPSFEDIAPEPDSAAPTPVSGEDITQPIRVNRARLPVARA